MWLFDMIIECIKLLGMGIGILQLGAIGFIVGVVALESLTHNIKWLFVSG